MKVIAVASAKGGVGKTTVGVNLAAALQQAGRNVLVVDLDPHNAVASHLQRGGIQARPGVADAILYGTPWRDTVAESTAGVKMIPFGGFNELHRHTLEQRLHEDRALLAQALLELDLPADSMVIVDTPPGPSAYLRQALGAADAALVVSLADAGLHATLPMIRHLIQVYCGERRYAVAQGLVINQVDCARQLDRDVAKVIQSAFGGRVVGVIHQDQAVAESLAFHQCVQGYAPYAQASLEFVQCAQAVETMLATAPATLEIAS